MEVGIVELEYYWIFHPILIRSGERTRLHHLTQTLEEHEGNRNTKQDATSAWGQKKKREKPSMHFYGDHLLEPNGRI